MPATCAAPLSSRQQPQAGVSMIADVTARINSRDIEDAVISALGFSLRLIMYFEGCFIVSEGWPRLP